MSLIAKSDGCPDLFPLTYFIAKSDGCPDLFLTYFL